MHLPRFEFWHGRGQVSGARRGLRVTPLEQACITFAFTAAWTIIGWFVATGGGAV